jgi:hypothetical protein
MALRGFPLSQLPVGSGGCSCAQCSCDSVRQGATAASVGAVDGRYSTRPGVLVRFVDWLYPDGCPWRHFGATNTHQGTATQQTTPAHQVVYCTGYLQHQQMQCCAPVLCDVLSADFWPIRFRLFCLLSQGRSRARCLFDDSLLDTNDSDAVMRAVHIILLFECCMRLQPAATAECPGRNLGSFLVKASH